MSTTATSAAEAFRDVHGGAPERVWTAPGRVNLIGEHTDYNDGFVLPVALAQTIRAAVRRRDDHVLRLHSAQADGGAVELSVDGLTPGGVPGWAAYPAGVVWALREAGFPVGGADIHLESDVPLGAGLSSSAALECVVATAYDDLHGLGLDSTRLALVAQRAENAFVGVPCGVMDQMASIACREGAALFLDTRDLSRRHIPLDLPASGLELLLLDTGVQHDLGDGAYAERRDGCRRAADELGLSALRDLPHTELDRALERLSDRALGRLVRHVVTENERVERTAELLSAGDVASLGSLLTAGHTSQRDDYDISCPQSDLAVQTALCAGALGARQTGGGFGGCVITLIPEGRGPAIADAVAAAFSRAGHQPPRPIPVTPSAGARRLA